MCIVDAQDRSTTVIAYPGQDVELMCTVHADYSNQTTAWLLNHVGPYVPMQLQDGLVTGYSSNGSNLIIENIMMNDDRNNTEYHCVVVWRDDQQEILEWSNTIYLFVMGEYQHCSISCIGSYIALKV